MPPTTPEEKLRALAELFDQVQHLYPDHVVTFIILEATPAKGKRDMDMNVMSNLASMEDVPLFLRNIAGSFEKGQIEITTQTGYGPRNLN